MQSGIILLGSTCMNPSVFLVVLQITGSKLNDSVIFIILTHDLFPFKSFDIRNGTSPDIIFPSNDGPMRSTTNPSYYSIECPPIS